MKTISKTAAILFLVSMIAISFAPVFADASDPSDPPSPTIYSAESIVVGRPVTVTGTGFTPSATIIFTSTCGNMSLQTVPNPVVADSSGAFTALLMTNNLGQGSCTVTATDGQTTAQETVTIYAIDHQDPNPCFSANNALSACCAEDNSHGLDVIACGDTAAPSASSLNRAPFQVADWQVRVN